jgi:hypothetical protein
MRARLRASAPAIGLVRAPRVRWIMEWDHGVGTLTVVWEWPRWAFWKPRLAVLHFDRKSARTLASALKGHQQEVV